MYEESATKDELDEGVHDLPRGVLDLYLENVHFPASQDLVALFLLC